MRLKVTLAAGAVFAAGFGLSAAPAQAGTIILEGSDAIGLHSTFGVGPSGAKTYRDEAWTAIGGASPKPIGVIGVGDGIPITSGTHAVMDFPTVAAAGTLSDYVALYFLAGGGCCSEDDTLIAGASDKTAVSAYLAAGGTVMIQDYEGHAAWDFAVGTSGGAGGAAADIGCSDGETVTADGKANGFVQPPIIGCWEHQAYDTSFFGPLGFTHSFFNAAGSPTGAFSGLLSSGVTVSHGVPEPATLALFGAGLMGLGALRRRKANKT